MEGHESLRLLAILDEVTVGIASIPARRAQLERTIETLAPQVRGQIHVYLNDYAEVPAFLQRPGIVAVLSSEAAGDLGDAGKFWGMEEAEGYVFTCDDDILYPPDYVEHMVARIEAYERKVAVGAHGAVFPTGSVERSYYAERQVFHCLRTVERDRCAHVLGTGVLAFHTDTLQVRPADFEAPNMADIWFGLRAQRERVPIVVVKHQAGWIRLQADTPGPTICDTYKGRDGVQTRAVQSIREWRLHPAPEVREHRWVARSERRGRRPAWSFWR